MKKIFIPALVILLTAACSQNQKKLSGEELKMAVSQIDSIDAANSDAETIRAVTRSLQDNYEFYYPDNRNPKTKTTLALVPDSVFQIRTYDFQKKAFTSEPLIGKWTLKNCCQLKFEYEGYFKYLRHSATVDFEKKTLTFPNPGGRDQVYVSVDIKTTEN